MSTDKRPFDIQFPFSNRVNSFRYYFDLTWHLVQRDFTLRYKGSVLGIFWVLAVPLMQLMTMVFVFKKVIPLHIDAYPAFVFTALLPWTWFSSSLSKAGSLFIGNRDLLRLPNFRPVILIIVNTISNLLLYLCVLPLVFLTLYVYGHSPSWTFSYVPLLMLVESLLIIGLSLMIATWNVFYRDVQQIVGVLVTLLFWITPIFYRARQVDPEYQSLYAVNPIAVLITNYREVMFYSHPLNWNSFFYSFAVSLGIAVVGYIVYNRQLHQAVDAL